MLSQEVGVLWNQRVEKSSVIIDLPLALRWLAYLSSTPDSVDSGLSLSHWKSSIGDSFYKGSEL